MADIVLRDLSSGVIVQLPLSIEPVLSGILVFSALFRRNIL